MIYFLFALIFVVTTWCYYVTVVMVYRGWKTFRWPARVMAVLAAIPGIPMDVALNVVASILLLDIPLEVTLSQKLSRLNDTGGWRGDVARWVCAELLDPFDPRGRHCK